jgi:hypothetical protein
MLSSEVEKRQAEGNYKGFSLKLQIEADINADYVTFRCDTA